MPTGACSGGRFVYLFMLSAFRVGMFNAFVRHSEGSAPPSSLTSIGGCLLSLCKEMRHSMVSHGATRVPVKVHISFATHIHRLYENVFSASI